MDALTGLKDSVVITAFGSQEEVVNRLVIPTYDWYEERHPIIDEAKHRENLGVRRIYGMKFLEDGSEDSRWLTTYDTEGLEVESVSWDRVGQISIWRSDEQGRVKKYYPP